MSSAHSVPGPGRQPAPRRPRRAPTVRAQLRRLVLVCVLPLSAAALLAIGAMYREGRLQLVDRARAEALVLSLATDAELGRAVAALQALATSPALATRDWGAFRAQALQVLADQRAVSVAVIDADNRQLMNTLAPQGMTLPAGGNDGRMKLAITQGQPVASDLFFGSVAQRPLLAVGVPGPRDGEGRIPFYIGMGFHPERLAAMIAAQRLEPGWHVSIVDNSGTIVARSHAPERFVGQPAAPALREAAASVSQGLIDGDVLDGLGRDAVPMFAGYARSPLSGWTVTVGVPQATLLASVRAWLLGLLVVVLTLLALALLAARLMARRIERAIGALVPPAHALGEGEPVAVRPQGLEEVDAVGTALMRAAELLRARTAERDEAAQARETLRARSEHLAHAASHDALTGLLNARRFTAELDERLAEARREGSRLTLCFIDIDDFKPVNDLHGHAVGDELLRAFAQRLRDGVRAADPVARLGGDEFGVLLEGVSPREALPIAQGLVERLSRPYAVRHERLVVSACIGLAGYPDHAETVEQLLEQADAAMYRGKQAGKRHCTVSGFMDL